VTAVLGPGGRGAVVLSEGEAAGLRQRLLASGLPTVTPAEAGLEVDAGGAPRPSEPVKVARFFAEATRRPTVARADDGWVVAGPDGYADRGGDDPVALCIEVSDRAPPRRVAVFGGAWIAEGDVEYDHIVELGRALAERETQIVCGGFQGAMAASSRGVALGGGVAVGVTISAWKEQVAVNPWLTHELVARDLFARLPLITDADAWVAFSGGVGTLHEVALCWNLVQTGLAEPRPLVLVGERWDRQLRLLREVLLVSDPRHFDLITSVATFREALEALA
jgi:uncharacterized protein (TIGR00730 family)